VIVPKTRSKPASEKWSRKTSECGDSPPPPPPRHPTTSHHISPNHTTSQQITPHLITSLHITPQLISYFNRHNSFGDLWYSLRETAGINFASGFKLVVVNTSPTVKYEALSPWSSASIGFEIGWKIIPSGLSDGGKKFS